MEGQSRFSSGPRLIFSIEEEGRGYNAHAQIGRVISSSEYSSSMEFLIWFHDGTKELYCRRLEVGAFQEESGTLVRTGIRYRPRDYVDLKDAERMAETLRYLNGRLPTTKRKLGAKMTFGGYVARAAEVLGIPSVVFPMPDGSLDILEIPQAAVRIDRTLDNSFG
ncbi:MAG: hypothetical protein ABSD38_35755 [Syntrophorhabdales bacterium]|jgi:hypothetical protein